MLIFTDRPDNEVDNPSSAVRAEPVEAFFDSVAGGLPASRVSARRPTYFSLLRQRNLRKRKATRLSGSLRFATGNLRCSITAGVRRTRFAQTTAALIPPSSALLGPAKRVEGSENGFGETRTRKAHPRRSPIWFSAFGFQFHPPSGCAEERRARRIRASDCLSEASSSSTSAGPSTAGCPRSVSEGGRRQQGRLFFGDFLLARQKKVTCRRATPGLLADQRPSVHVAASIQQPTGGKC